MGISHLGRREILKGLLAVPFTQLGFDPAKAESVPSSLGVLAKRKGILFGTSCVFSEIAPDQAYADLVKAESAIIVAGNDLKWFALRPQPDQFNFARADALMAFAERIGVPIRGHTLVWHEALPKWFGRTVTAQTAGPLLAGHITTVCGRYRGRLHSWDVVNEAIAPEDGRADDLRDTPWLRTLGPGYIAEAFRLAAGADPTAILTYNDYGLSDDSRAARRKRAAVLRLLDRLKRDDAPIHAVGLQAHLTTDMRFDPRALTDFLDQIADRGLKVMITELDVFDDSALRDPAGQDGRVARIYGDFLDIVLPHRATVACLTWGLSDRYSWLRFVERRAPAGDLRPLPYDQDYRRKPAWDAIAASLARLPDRT